MSLPSGERVLWRGRPAWRERFLEISLEVFLAGTAAGLLACEHFSAALACLGLATLAFLHTLRSRMSRSYLLSEERLQVRSGLLSRELRELDLREVARVDVAQTFGQRLLGLGDVAAFSRLPDVPPLVFQDVSRPLAVKERVRLARQKTLSCEVSHGLREEAPPAAAAGEAFVSAPGQGQRGDPHRAADPASAA